MLIPLDVLSGFTLDARVDITLAQKQSTDFSGQSARKESKQRVRCGLLLLPKPTSRKEYVGSEEQDSLRAFFASARRAPKQDQIQVADPALSLKLERTNRRPEPPTDLIQIRTAAPPTS